MTWRQSWDLPALGGSCTTRRGSKRVSGETLRSESLVRNPRPTERRAVTSPALGGGALLAVGAALP